jgi:hypothetical protein
MITGKTTVKLGVMENAYAAMDGGLIKIYWYGGGNIRYTALSAAGTVITPARNTALFCDAYAFTPDKILIYEGGGYTVENR